MAVGDDQDQRQRTQTHSLKKSSTNAQHPTNNADIKDWPNSGDAPRARRTRKSQGASAETPKSSHEQQQRQLGGCLSAPRCACALERCSRHFWPSGQGTAEGGRHAVYTQSSHENKNERPFRAGGEARTKKKKNAQAKNNGTGKRKKKHRPSPRAPTPHPPHPSTQK